jgi:cob(I)alamin adenosyltransferase
VRIYTKTGDGGETGLLGGGRVRKSAIRVEAYGAVDELNACLGLAAAALAEPEPSRLLADIQRDLLAVGSRLSDLRKASSASGEKARLSEEHVARLERAIDGMETSLPPLRAFILPGGSEAGARLHLARTVCRRAERRIVALAEREDVPPILLAYMNRLSDLLFVLARSVNHHAGAGEVTW